MSAVEHDVVVIGAGPAGEVFAGRLAKAGLEVAIIESHLVAGECSFYACMPSKALLRPGHLLAEARRVPGVAQAVTAELDVDAVLARRDEIIHDLDDGAQTPWLDKLGITLYRGHGRLAGARRVVVEAVDGGAPVELHARRAVALASGSRASLPPIDGLADAKPWTNREATTTRELPARVAFLGTGPVGCELADAYSLLGVQVTLIGQDDRLLAKEEPFAGQQLLEVLQSRGVEVLLGTQVQRVSRPESGGEISITLASGGGRAQTVDVDELVVAAGRTPNSDQLGLASVGVETDEHGFVGVDRQLRVDGRDWLYALGDVNGRALLTHEGKYQAHVAAQVVLGSRAALLRDGPPPVRCVFTEPQVAAVGYTAASARDAGLEIRVVDVPTDGNAGASFVGKGSPGTCRIIVDESRGVIVGATFTGVEVGDQLHAATVAITAAVPISRLWDAVPAFPSRTEVWLRLLEAYEGW